MTNPRCNATTYVLEARRRAKESPRPHGVTERFAYDQSSNRALVQNRNGNVLTYGYEQQHRLSAATVDGET